MQWVLILSVTLFGLGGLGYFLMYFFHVDEVREFLHADVKTILISLAAGTTFGIIALAPLIFLLRLPLLKETTTFFTGLMQKFRVGHLHIFAISICAGVGEELLFRGAVQPWLGIWLTAFIFVALHGYLNPKDPAMALYGTTLCIVSAGFGYLTNYFHLSAAMTAHTVIDLGLLYYLRAIGGRYHA